MSSRSRAVKSLAQTRLAEVITTYVNYLSNVQASLDSEGFGEELAPLNPRFPYFDNFCAEREPAISVQRYVDRLVAYMYCSVEVFIYALAYLRRIVALGCPLHSRSVHRLLFTAVVVAAKVRDDFYWSMLYYAQVGGVDKQDLQTMELRFLLNMINFRAEVMPEEYREITQSISLAVKHVPLPINSTSDLASSYCSVSTVQSEERKTFNSVHPVRSVPDWAIECEVYW